MGKLPKNLQHFEMRDSNLNLWLSVQAVQSGNYFCNLREVDINHCGYIYVSDIVLLLFIASLKLLSIQDCPFFIDLAIEEARQSQACLDLLPSCEMILRKCHGLNDRALIDICFAFKRVHTADLRGNPGITRRGVEIINEKAPNCKVIIGEVE